MVKLEIKKKKRERRIRTRIKMLEIRPISTLLHETGREHVEQGPEAKADLRT